jgi:hypothetical protein
MLFLTKLGYFLQTRKPASWRAHSSTLECCVSGCTIPLFLDPMSLQRRLFVRSFRMLIFPYEVLGAADEVA